MTASQIDAQRIRGGYDERTRPVTKLTTPLFSFLTLLTSDAYLLVGWLPKELKCKSEVIGRLCNKNQSHKNRNRSKKALLCSITVVDWNQDHPRKGKRRRKASTMKLAFILSTLLLSTATNAQVRPRWIEFCPQLFVLFFLQCSLSHTHLPILFRILITTFVKEMATVHHLPAWHCLPKLITVKKVPVEVRSF